jgi:ribosomal protein S18 acetylase RimI-like enzyme
VTGYKVRPAAASDIADITRLYIHLSEHHRALAPEAPRYQVDPTGWKDYASKMFDDPRSFLFVAIEDGRVIGFVGTGLVDKPWGTSYEIKTMIVEEDERGRGVGTALLRHVEDHAVEVGGDALRVDVLLQNAEGRRFYEKAGYEASSVRHGKPLPKN